MDHLMRIRNTRSADPTGSADYTTATFYGPLGLWWNVMLPSLSIFEVAERPVYIIRPWEMPSLWRKELGMEKRGSMVIIKDAEINDI